MHQVAEDPPGDRAGDSAGERAAEGPNLPYAKAFVVQFSAETDAGFERAAGRVEHLRTGRRVRFASINDLLACLATLLADEAPLRPGGSEE